MDTNTKRKAWLYYRVSTGHVEQDSSLEVQREVCRRFCEEQGWEIVGESQDRKSGTKLTRAGFREAATAIATGAADVLVAKHLSRFARTTEFAAFLRDEIHGHGKDMITVEGNFDTRTAAGRFQLNVLLASFQFTVEQQGEQVKLGKKIRKEQGYHSSFPPFGTMANPEQAGVPIKHPDEWPVYEEIMDLAGQGVPYLQIARRLDERKVPTRFGGTWTDQSVRRIVRNEFYADPKMLHDCKIPREQWEAAQCRNPRGARPTSKHAYLLRGIVYNGFFTVVEPGHSAGGFAPMGTVPSASGKPRYVIRAQYRSEHHKVERIGECPGIPVAAVNADWLDTQVMERLRELSAETQSQALRMDGAYEAAREYVKTEMAAAQKRVTRAEKSVATAQRRLMKALDNDLDTLIPELQQTLAVQRADLAAHQAQRTELLDKLATINKAQPLAKLTTEPVYLVDTILEQQNWSAARDLIRGLINSIIVRIYRVAGSSERMGEVEIVWHDADYLEEVLGVPVKVFLGANNPLSRLGMILTYIPARRSQRRDTRKAA